MAKRANGSGCVVRLKYKDAAGNKCETKNYYILYRVGGRRIRECAETESKMEAEQLLQRRMGEFGLGIKPAQDVKNLKYETIREAYLKYAHTEKLAFFKDAEGNEYLNGMQHLDDFFKGMRVVAITSDVLQRYIEHRREAGASDPTIRRNLVILRAMMNLARKQNRLRLSDVPYFPMPKDSPAAGQYIDAATFEKILTALPENLRPFFTFMYATACRLGALQQIRWSMVNTDCTEIKLPADIMKADKPLTLVLAGPILSPIAKMLRKSFRTDGPVFDSTNYRPAWSKACEAAGVGTYDKKARTRTGVRIHDCRCSGAVNLVDSGVDEDLVMKIGAWSTRSMFSRYNIMNSERMRAAMVKSGEYVQRQQRKARA
jgi:integrase